VNGVSFERIADTIATQSQGEILRSEDWSYQRHISHERKLEALPSCYTAPESIDAWRHQRMLSTTLTLLEAYPNSTWLTLGDGTYGSDAHYLKIHGADATASSLTDATLKSASERGYIGKYRAENAEALTMKDNSFEFVLCKESYHHFPRPPIAFYEMWRVAEKAVVLIEPYDDRRRVLDSFKYLVKKLLRGDSTDQFEPVGNFLYRVNVREIEKMATALNGACVAVKLYNDFYYAKASADKYHSITVGSLITKLGIFVQDTLSRMRLLNFGLVTVMVFKQDIDAALRKDLHRRGFSLSELPRNPYLPSG
jgi:ubiquinone/menaquinone biosynthesis C-methylase UbiE